jgi:hypothetical protein
MPMISGRHKCRAVLLDVVILPIEADAVASSAVIMEPFRALIDTGSSVTYITSRVISVLKLRPYGTKQMGNVYSIANHRTFLVRLGFPISATDQPAVSLYVLPKVIVAPEMRSMDHFDVLIGMDVISQGDPGVLRDGTFDFSFESA